jgi:hypothetical protein
MSDKIEIIPYRALPVECRPGCDCTETPNPLCGDGKCECAWCAECALPDEDGIPAP